MKKVAMIMLGSLLSIHFLFAGDMKWYSWNEAQELSETQEKPIMVFVYASWCHLCNRMDTKVFTNEEIAELLNENFIPVKLDAESSDELQKEGISYKPMELLAELTDNQFRGIPAYVFIPDKSNKKSKLFAGLKDIEEMKALLEKYK